MDIAAVMIMGVGKAIDRENGPRNFFLSGTPLLRTCVRDRLGVLEAAAVHLRGYKHGYGPLDLYGRRQNLQHISFE